MADYESETGSADGTKMTTREAEVYEQFCKRMSSSLRHSQEWRDEARELFDFEAGRQWDPADEISMKEKNRPMVTLNLVIKFIDAVTGLQINNRQEIRVYPRTLGSAALSDVATGALDWSREQCDAVFEETDAGHDTLLTGMGWTEHFLNEENDPAGTIDKERRDPLEMLWDPMARKKNLVDSRYVIRLKPCTREEARELLGTDAVVSVGFPGVTDELLENFSKALTRDDYDSTDSGMSAEAMGKALIADYQWFEKGDLIPVTVALPVGPQMRELTPEEWSKLEPELVVSKVPYQVGEKRKGRIYYRCWISGGGVRGGIKRIRQGEFLYQAITGKRDRNKNLWFGLGRTLVDPQKWVNKFFSSIIWQLSVNPKGGLMMEEDAAEDVEQVKSSWADPSGVSVFAPGALANNKVKEKPAMVYPSGMDRLMTFSMEALPQVSGINAELLGLTDRDQAGVVEAQRKQGALAIIAWYFDALHRHYKQSGRLTLAMIRDFIADDRLIRIVGKDGAQYVPLARKALTENFDLVVDEAPTSVNMRERVWGILQAILPMALQAGIRVPPEVLDYMPIPADLAQKWRQQLGAPPEEQQKQQQQFLADLRETLASARQKESAAVLNEARAQEVAQTTPAQVANLQAQTAKTGAEAGAALAGE